MNKQDLRSEHARCDFCNKSNTETKFDKAWQNYTQRNSGRQQKKKQLAKKCKFKLVFTKTSIQRQSDRRSGFELLQMNKTDAAGDLETTAAELRDTLKATIWLECVYYSASTNIWTSKSKRRFISFTLHYLDEDFKMHSWVLEVKLLPGKHDVHHIADALQECIEE
ncbi:Hypothetical protein PHPALM_11909 [Phytophthora palmivora]|uniref:Uncharacterized protein n=1 Tax=Phytophthora palmivora TaxID=4796 RepID=A0A2P4Y137_9STRA|nr:Hypothetical protein PHPALM_11909 [Phytophthora palmivora]